MRMFLFSHGFSQMSFARVLAHRIAIAYGDLPSETQAFLRRISARTCLEWRSLLTLASLFLALSLAPALALGDSYMAGDQATLASYLKSSKYDGSTIYLTSDIKLTGGLTNWVSCFSKGVTIEGSGHTIDGAGKVNLLRINSGNVVTFRNVVFANGCCEGGAISNGGEASFVNCSFVGNRSTSAGAVVQGGQSAEFLSCTFFDNSPYAIYGGGLEIANCTFVNNDVYMSSGTAYVLNSIFANCDFCGSCSGSIDNCHSRNEPSSMWWSIKDCTSGATPASCFAHGSRPSTNANGLVYFPLEPSNARVTKQGKWVVPGTSTSPCAAYSSKYGDCLTTDQIGQTIGTPPSIGAIYTAYVPNIAATATGYVGLYDKNSHSITVSVTQPTSGATIEYALTSSGPWSTTNPSFTDVCEPTKVWYRVTADGYATKLGYATISISEIPVKITVTATPRYPWSGKVDVDLTLTGDADEKYLISLAATDIAGGTNLPVKTVSLGGGRGATALPSTSIITLTPGTHRLVWDADADIAVDAEFPRVTMSASATLQQRYSVRFNANGGDGTMADEAFVTNEVKSLTTNAFTRTGYAFSGWATSASGEVAYADKAEVENLTPTHRGVVDLYAVWKKALYMVVDLSGGSTATSYPVSYLNAVPSGGWSDQYKTTKLVLRLVGAGSFAMGDPRKTAAAFNQCHRVTISSDFYIGVFEITQNQYALVTGKNPSYFTTDCETRPVEMVSFGALFESSGFVTLMRAKTQMYQLSLPTDAQWEFACRAGSTNAICNCSGDESGLTYRCTENSNYVNFDSASDTWRRKWDSLQATAKVGTYPANALGLYDMHGNVMEWCRDWYEAEITSEDVIDPTGPTTGTYRVVRGGSWAHGSYYCYSYNRHAELPTYRMYNYMTTSPYFKTIGFSDIGFRVCCPAE